MGAHILHAGPSCIIQPSTSGPRADPLHLKHHRGICYSSLLCKQKGGVAAGKCGLGNACCICKHFKFTNLTVDQYFTFCIVFSSSKLQQYCPKEVSVLHEPRLPWSEFCSKLFRLFPHHSPHAWRSPNLSATVSVSSLCSLHQSAIEQSCALH